MPAAPTTQATALGSVLVTGGCGFLGSHIVSLLKERYPAPATTISVMDLRTSINTFEGVEYHAADLTSPDATQDIFAKVKPDVVIHTASPVFNTVTPKTKDVMYKVNVEGTRNLLSASKKAGVKAFVYTSSASVISDARTDLINADERYLTIRGSLQNEYYSDTKAEAEGLVLDANVRPSATASATSEDSLPLLTVALRPSAMFGERDVQFVPNVIQALHDGRTAYQLGANDNLWDLTYIGNVAHAHLLAAARLLEAHAALKSGASTAAAAATADADADAASDARVDGEAFLITNAAPVYFWDFARAIWVAYHAATRARAPAPAAPAQRRVLPRSLALFLATLLSWLCWAAGAPPPKLDPARVRFSCMTRYFRVSKAQALLGYTPVWSLDEAVERTAVWFARQRFPDAPRETKKAR